MANIKKNSIADTNIDKTLSHLDQLKKIQLESEQYTLNLKKQQFEHKEALNKWTQLLKEKEVLMKQWREEDYLRRREKQLEKEREDLRQSRKIDFDKSAGLKWVNARVNGPVGSQMTNLAISALTGGFVNPIIAKTLKMHKLVEYSMRGIVGLINWKGFDGGWMGKNEWESRSSSALKNEKENTPTFRKLNDIYNVVVGISKAKDPIVEKKKNAGLSDFLTTLGTIGKILLTAIAGFGAIKFLPENADMIKNFVAGAIPGLLLGGIPGAILGGIAGLGIGKITEWWNDFTGKAGITAEENKKITPYIIIGAITGLRYGGIYGALLGGAIGGIAGVILEEPKEFEDAAHKKAWEDKRLTAAIIGGAVFGLKKGGIYGALVGALIGGAGEIFWQKCR